MNFSNKLRLIWLGRLLIIGGGVLFFWMIGGALFYEFSLSAFVVPVLMIVVGFVLVRKFGSSVFQDVIDNINDGE